MLQFVGIILLLHSSIAFKLKPFSQRCKFSVLKNDANFDNESVNVPKEMLTSREITRLQKKIEETISTINEVQATRKQDEAEISKLNDEFGSEISRIKREFARIKERAIEEATATSDNAKLDALKEVLPITDNYFRAKSVFEPYNINDEEEMAIANTYENIFNKFESVIQGFGVTRLESLGKPFDFQFMEAIMTAPSTEYAKDIVCKEYQIGYKMGEKSVRPSMVVVSTGPGPTPPLS